MANRNMTEDLADSAHKCPDCPKSYSTLPALRRHRAEKHGDNPNGIRIKNVPKRNKVVYEDDDDEPIGQLDPRIIDQHKALTMETGLNMAACRKMSTYETDVVTSDSEEVTTSYEQVEYGCYEQKIVSYKDENRGTYELANPYAPPKGFKSCRGSTSNSRNSRNTRSISGRDSSNRDSSNRDSSPDRSFDFKRNLLTQKERKSIYGSLLNDTHEQVGAVFYEKNYDSDDGCDFYENRMRPQNKPEEVDETAETFETVETFESANIVERHRDREFPESNKNSQNSINNWTLPTEDRSEDWLPDPRFDDSCSNISTFSTPTPNIHNNLRTSNGSSNVGKFKVDKALADYSKDVAIRTLTSIDTEIPKNIEDVEDFEELKVKESKVDMIEQSNNNSNSNLSNPEQKEKEKEKELSKEVVLPPLSFMIQPKTLGTIRVTNPVYYTDGSIKIKCIVPEDYISCLTEYYNNATKAIVYIKNNGIASDSIESDFKTIKKIYLEGRKKSEIPFRVPDLSRHRFEFLDSEKKWRRDSNGQQCSRILCDNLMNAFLKMNNDMIAKILGSGDADTREALLDEYQINKTQTHAHNLGDTKFRNKLMKRIMDFVHGLSEDQIIEK